MTEPNPPEPDTGPSTPSAAASTFSHHPLGIDFGGSGIKGAPVDLRTGEFAAERLRFDTPQPSTPEAVAKIVAEIAEHFHEETGDSPIGVTVPGVVRNGKVLSAANIDKGWIGTDADKLFSDAVGRPVHVVNDADAAGLAEVKYGAVKDRPGLIIVTTLGTGIGSAIIYNGVLVPNAELGHLEIGGYDAESRASGSVKENSDMSWEQWAKRLTKYYGWLEFLFSPDVMVVGGGISKKSSKFLPLIKINTPLIPAKLLNTAGIVGAAWLANDRYAG